MRSAMDKVREMTEAGCQKILFFPLYPHYAGATSATANDEFFRALMQDERFFTVPKILETPKGDDNSLDLRNLALLHELAGGL